MSPEKTIGFVRSVSMMTWIALTAYMTTFVALFLSLRQNGEPCSCGSVMIYQGTGLEGPLMVILLGFGALTMHSLVQGLFVARGWTRHPPMAVRMIIVSILAHVCAYLLAWPVEEFSFELGLAVTVAGPMALMALHARWFYRNA